MIETLERNELLGITKQFARQFGVKDIAVIEGDACQYIGKRPTKTTKVSWPQEIR
jgi:precorrin-6B methylase 2